MTTLTTKTTETNATYTGNDRLLFGMILGVLAFWLFAQTTLNISPTMAADLGIQMSVMNIAVSITALFSGIFIVVLGGLADRVGRVKVVQWGRKSPDGGGGDHLDHADSAEGKATSGSRQLAAQARGITSQG